MKNQLFVLIAFICFAELTNAQQSKLVGSWLITKVETKNKIEKPYQIIDFSEDGKMIIMGMEVGTWSYNKSTNAIVLKSEFDKDFNGVCTIEKLDENRLITTKDRAKIEYIKIHEAKIETANKNAGLEGSWRLNASGSSKLINFELPNSFSFIEKDDGSISTTEGTWIFNPVKKSLLIIGFHNPLHGKNTIVDFGAEKIVLENDGNKLELSKEKTNSVIEHLTFTEDDFFTEDGDFKFEADLDKLPWQDPMMMMMSLVNVKQLVYKYSTLVENTGVFEVKTLIANVVSNPQEQKLCIDNIFYGYDRYNLPENSDLPPNNDYNHILYPDEENTFRLAGTEEVTTPAGTFDCAIMEVITSRDVLKKIWMIIDKPGVYAKIIDENPDESWGHYSIYELQEIKTVE